MIHFTAQQQRVIRAPGNVAVVAGAGSGKTSTLVERCLACVLNGSDPASLDEILMVTFTDAAATEMRNRIRERLATALKAGPGNERVENQLALLDAAHIGTLHSFCLQLIRQHFHQLGLDPQIAILDERQTRPLELTVLDRLFAKHYAGDEPLDRAVRLLIREQGHGSDEPIRRLALKLHRFSQTLADPSDWIAKQLAFFRQSEPTRWRAWLLEGFVEWRAFWLPALQPLEATPNIAACAQALSRAPTSPALDDIRRIIAAITEADQNEWPSGTKTTVRDEVKEFFEDAEFFGSLVDGGGGSDPLAEDWQWARQPMLALLDLAQEFTAEFTRAKRELCGVDFADLDQLALQVLRDRGTVEPTPAAETWRAKFRHIFVDEYQDINAAQDAILILLSRGGSAGNRFLVGDVKQSIYRFRLADPRIFREYQGRWREGSPEGRSMPLSENFRSREALLEFINSLFRTLMRPALGGVDYDATAEMQFGDPERRAPLRMAATGSAQNDPAPARVEFHLLAKPGAAAADEEEDDAGNANDPADLDPVEKEARLIAHRLRKLREQGDPVWDDKGDRFRPVEWRDMVILMRSVGDRAERFAKEFSRAAVPLLASRGGFYSALEVMDLLNALRLLDNPLQDLPLLAVLHSPLVGLSAMELAQVRAQTAAKPFWTALQHACRVSGVRGASSTGATGAGANAAANRAVQLPEETLARIDSFLSSFEGWRRLIRRSSLSHCLETILDETHYEALLLAGERGRERAANVRRLLDLARQYDPYQRQGLFRFLRFIEAQAEAELDQEPAGAPTENAVRLTTIHKSKGLEWPVVVVAGMGAQFNFKDSNEDILLDEEYGLCPRVKLPDSDQFYPSLAHWLAARRAKRELLGEELRLLYVALTRARDTLLLVGAARKKADAAPWTESARVTDHALASARCYLDWLRLWLPRGAGESDESNGREGANELLRWKIHDPRDPVFASLDNALAETAPSVSEQSLTAAELAGLRTRLEWRYPYEPATREPAKTSVTRLRRRRGDETDEAVRRLFQASGFRLDIAPRQRAGPGRVTAAEIGAAHHTFLELVSLERVGSLPELQAEAERLKAEAVLSGEEIEVLDLAAVADFWQSKLGRQLLARRAHLHREVPFTARFSPEDLQHLNLVRDAAQLGDEFLVVQGYVDLAVILPKEIWLVDFKTDVVRGPELDAKVADFERQLKLYGLALRRIYNRPVTASWLHFLAPKKTVPVGKSE